MAEAESSDVQILPEILPNLNPDGTVCYKTNQQENITAIFSELMQHWLGFNKLKLDESKISHFFYLTEEGDLIISSFEFLYIESESEPMYRLSIFNLEKENILTINIKVNDQIITFHHPTDKYPYRYVIIIGETKFYLVDNGSEGIYYSVFSLILYHLCRFLIIKHSNNYDLYSSFKNTIIDNINMNVMKYYNIFFLTKGTDNTIEHFRKDNTCTDGTCCPGDDSSPCKLCNTFCLVNSPNICTAVKMDYIEIIKKPSQPTSRVTHSTNVRKLNLQQLHQMMNVETTDLKKNYSNFLSSVHQTNEIVAGYLGNVYDKYSYNYHLVSFTDSIPIIERSVKYTKKKVMKK